MALPPAGAPMDMSLPEGYKAHWNTQYNAWFYENVFTGASVWEKPTQPAPQARPQPKGPPPGYQAVQIENKGNDQASLHTAMASISLGSTQNTTQQQQPAYVPVAQQPQIYNPYPSPGDNPQPFQQQHQSQQVLAYNPYPSPGVSQSGQPQAYNPYPSPGATSTPVQYQPSQQSPQHSAQQAYNPYPSPGAAVPSPVSQQSYLYPQQPNTQAAPSLNPASQQSPYVTQQPYNPTQSIAPNSQAYIQPQSPSSGANAPGPTSTSQPEISSIDPTDGTKGFFSPIQQQSTQPGYINHQTHQSPLTTGGYPTPAFTPYSQQQPQYGQPPQAPQQQYAQNTVYNPQNQQTSQTQYPQQQVYSQPVFSQQPPQQQIYGQPLPAAQGAPAQNNAPAAAKAGLMRMLGGGVLGGLAAKAAGGKTPSHPQVSTPAVHGTPQPGYGQQPAYNATAQPGYGAPAPAAAPAANPEKKSNAGALALLGGGAGLLAGGALVTGLMSGHKKKKKKKKKHGDHGGGHGEEGEYYEEEEYETGEVEEVEADGGGWGFDLFE
ncbi:hypothetical protein HYALB_00006581 [Hymenoscyphus albidus]|uniref:WW domain-containing protein n=1 Tax=Hymenoscyphus albidus TaxID=595503 RepID=A0A9N9LXK4_9HELO|nr:hypothetical protein HYALB_00006581 [Hymenoscyphus albidus]